MWLSSVFLCSLQWIHYWVGFGVHSCGSLQYWTPYQYHTLQGMPSACDWGSQGYPFASPLVQINVSWHRGCVRIWHLFYYFLWEDFVPPLLHSEKLAPTTFTLYIPFLSWVVLGPLCRGRSACATKNWSEAGHSSSPVICHPLSSMYARHVVFGQLSFTLETVFCCVFFPLTVDFALK